MLYRRGVAALVGLPSGSRSVSSLKAGVSAKVCAILGAQWGDEGKGKLADVLAKNYDVVARFNGGANAGHTVVVGDKKFAFHLLPCGIIYPHTTNLLGNGTVVHLPSLFDELKDLDGAGVPWAGRLKISDRAHMLFDFHKRVDGLMEERRAGTGGGGKIGTTKQGIGPCYAAKAARNGIRFGMLAHPDSLRKALSRLIADTSNAFQVDIDEKEEQEKLAAWRARVLPWVVDGVAFVNGALDAGKRVITEGANAALLDVDFGTYPYVTSSSTSAGGVCTGLGIAPSRIQAVVGVVKAYTTRVGGGPFPTELTDERGGGDRPLNAPGTEEGLHLQRVGREVGVTTGRKRRCGWFDAVVVRYAHTLNGFTSLNLTKLDVLDDMATLRLGVAYKLRGQLLPPGAMPSTLEDLAAVEVVYEDLPGWKTSTQGITEFSKLPKEAQKYVKRIEAVTGVPVAWVGTGPKRADMMARGFTMDA